jgi:hypothetical protein
MIAMVPTVHLADNMSTLSYHEDERLHVGDVRFAGRLVPIPVPVLVRDEYDDYGRLVLREVSRY